MDWASSVEQQQRQRQRRIYLLARLNSSGNRSNNAISGNSGNNSLYGLNGKDTLNGLLDNDVLYGGVGNDAFVFNSVLNAATNTDIIDDFTVGQDAIRPAQIIFTTAGGVYPLSAADFHIGTATADAADRISSASGESVQFATVSGGLSMTNADLLLCELSAEISNVLLNTGVFLQQLKLMS